VTNTRGKVIFEGNQNNVADRRKAHRGDREKQGPADQVSEEAELAFRQQAGLAVRKADERVGFFTWPDAPKGSEMPGVLAVSFQAPGAAESTFYVIVCGEDGGFLELWTGADAWNKVLREWEVRKQRIQGR